MLLQSTHPAPRRTPARPSPAQSCFSPAPRPAPPPAHASQFHPHQPARPAPQYLTQPCANLHDAHTKMLCPSPPWPALTAAPNPVLLSPDQPAPSTSHSTLPSPHHASCLLHPTHPTHPCLLHPAHLHPAHPTYPACSTLPTPCTLPVPPCPPHAPCLLHPAHPTHPACSTLPHPSCSTAPRSHCFTRRSAPRTKRFNRSFSSSVNITQITIAFQCESTNIAHHMDSNFLFAYIPWINTFVRLCRILPNLHACKTRVQQCPKDCVLSLVKSPGPEPSLKNFFKMHAA